MPNLTTYDRETSTEPARADPKKNSEDSKNLAIGKLMSGLTGNLMNRFEEVMQVEKEIIMESFVQNKDRDRGMEALEFELQRLKRENGLLQIENSNLRDMVSQRNLSCNY